MDQDWELLHNAEPGLVIPSESFNTSNDYNIETEGIIRSDYFASDGVTVAESVGSCDEEGEGSVVSDNPSWVDPKNGFSGEVWSDASSDGSGSHKNQNFDGKEELGVREFSKREVGVEGIGEILELEAKNDDFSKIWSDSGGAGVAEEVEAAEIDEGGGGEAEEERKVEVKVLGEGNKEGMVWWKVPFEILKFCLFKVSPGWSIAVAAAVMGIVIMRRRLYRMKRKSRRVPLEITVEDKKVSQFMKNAARLNEAFSVVKRVPMIRPLLPAPGLTPWPVINLR